MDIRLSVRFVIIVTVIVSNIDIVGFYAIWKNKFYTIWKNKVEVT